MLLLRLQTPNGRYVLDVTSVVEVIPFVHYTKVSHGPDFLSGVINFRGHPLPVLDLGLLIDATPCRERMNTRIILTRIALTERKKLFFGIIAEGVSGTLRLERNYEESSEILLQELTNPQEADGQQLLQLLNMEKILGPERIAKLSAYC